MFRRAWRRPIFVSKCETGREASPQRRTPDVEYAVHLAPQKASLAQRVEQLPLRYSVAFKSKAERLPPYPGEVRALSYPPNATDSFDLSALASASSLRKSASEASNRSMAWRTSQPRGPPMVESAGATMDVLAADQQHWMRCGQPLTASSERFGLENEHETNPGPGSYLGLSPWPAGQTQPTKQGKAAQRSFDSSLEMTLERAASAVPQQRHSTTRPRKAANGKNPANSASASRPQLRENATR